MKPRNYILRFSLLLASVIGAMLVFSASHPAYAQAQHMKINGAGADGSACGSNGLCASVSVGRNNTGQTTETFVSFNSSRRDPATGIFTFEFGFGAIPNEALAGDTPGQSLKNLSLNLDLAQARAGNPDFFARRITCLPPPCPGCQSPCTGADLLAGVLTATFTKTDEFTSRSHGTLEERTNLPDGSFLIFRSVGMSEFSSAIWTANFFGTLVETNFVRANIGGFRSVDITIEKTEP